MKDVKTFAIYRLPDEETIHLIEPTATSVSCRLETSYESQTGFVMVPFCEDGQHLPIIIRRGVHCMVERCDVVDLLRAHGIIAHTEALEAITTHETQRTYMASYDRFHKALESGHYQKLVLSQTFPILMTDPVQTFVQLLDAYPHSLVYVAYSPEAGMWLGASPEVLLKADDDRLSTMSLAGTKSRGDEPWDEKNQREQAYVTDYIREVVASYGDDLHEDGPRTMQTGNLYHLCTTFDFRLKASHTLYDVVEALHPTPAVCGLPKREAMQFISSHESHQRSYYAGYVGPLNVDGHTQFHVNIRCAECHADGTATSYAGSGLLLSSDADSEWQEVMRKAQTIDMGMNE